MKPLILLAFMLKNRAGRMRRARRSTRTFLSAPSVRRPSRFRFPTARAAFAHEVFWTRMAPRQISSVVSPGHQSCGPKRA